MTRSDLVDELLTKFPQLSPRDAELTVKILLDAMSEQPELLRAMIEHTPRLGLGNKIVDFEQRVGELALAHLNLRDQRPELLERSPGTEGFCRLLGLVAGRDRQCPEVQPGRAFVGNLVGRMSQADVVADLALVLVGDERAGDTGIDPDYAFFAVEQRKVFVETVA